ncbi:hypothetical protein BHM03_00018141 [Ensete ventricosum]|nr:hypothetical protein BHM03_00018141 [Ensete ventricosum]
MMQVDIVAEFGVNKSALAGAVDAVAGYNCSTSGGAAGRGVLGPFGLLVLADDDLSEQTAVYFYFVRSTDGSISTHFCHDELRPARPPALLFLSHLRRSGRRPAIVRISVPLQWLLFEGVAGFAEEDGKMLQKFALAVKTKTIEFFAEEDEEEEEERAVGVDDSDACPAPEEVITGQRVVVLRPDPAPGPDPETLAAAALAGLSSFQAAYLHLQTAHSPFVSDAVRSADRAAVSHLRRLSELKRLYLSAGPGPSPSLTSALPLSFLLEAQVLDNQDLLRIFEALVDRLQSDIDRKDAEAAVLEKALADLDGAGVQLADRLERACMPAEERVESLLTVGVFDSVLRDTCRLTHRFARVLVDLMNLSGWNLGAAANCICPDVNFTKPGHCRYAILSYICLGMFGGFDSYDFCDDGDGVDMDEIDVSIRRTDSLQQFIEHSALDPLELMRDFPSSDFVKFCKKKYAKLIHPGIESSLLRNSATGESSLGSLTPSSPLYESFASMASSIWMLQKLAWAYNPVVEIFQVARGTEFSMVFMETIVPKFDKLHIDSGTAPRPKVGFTVVPGFHVGKTVIQSRVYLDDSEQTL